MKHLIDSIRSLANKAQFASLLYTAKTSGETARYTVILGAKYGALLEKSLLALSLLDLASLAKEKNFDLSLLETAKTEVQKSLEKSISAHKEGKQSDDYTKQGQYIPLGSGLNLNETDLSLQLFGLIQSKVVIVPGEHKQVKSAPLTIAKNVIRKQLPIAKFREFALDLGNIHIAKIDGETLVLE